MAKLRFEIEGTPGDVQFQSYFTALSSAVSVLRELDAATSGKYRGQLRWYVSGLSSDGTLAIDLLSRIKPLKATGDEPAPIDNGGRVASAFVRGLENLERHGTSPPYLSEFGLVRVKHMLDEIERNGARGYRATSLDDGHTVDVSGKARETVRELLPTDRFALGSVEGTLEAISIHKTRRFVVYHAVTKRAVTCKWNADDDAILKAAVNALGARVMVSGRVQFNMKGDPVRVRAEAIRVLGDGVLPTVRDLAGSEPDLTDGLSTHDFIRSIRD